ncbi:MAG: MerR family transcriptional regulator [Dehalococcoidia bacterium]
MRRLDTPGGARWRVGAVARATGLCVRTLRHYDALGLVRPAERTAAGYREYSADDVRRVYCVRSLQGLGLSLGEIRGLLEDSARDLPALVQRQIERADLEIRAAKLLRRRLQTLAEALRESAAPLDGIRAVLEVIAMTGQYYTPEQLEQLERRAEAMGPGGLEAAQRAWATLIEEMEAARTSNADPASAEVQALAARWRDLIAQFTGGDAGIRASLERMYQDQGVETASRGTVSPELMAYVGRATNAAGDASAR